MMVRDILRIVRCVKRLRWKEELKNNTAADSCDNNLLVNFAAKLHHQGHIFLFQQSSGADTYQ